MKSCPQLVSQTWVWDHAQEDRKRPPKSSKALFYPPNTCIPAEDHEYKMVLADLDSSPVGFHP